MLVLVLLYRIVLEPSPRVVFDNGEELPIAYANGKITAVESVDLTRHRLPRHVTDGRFAAAILVAHDLALTTGDIRSYPLETTPPLVLVRMGNAAYIERIGLVQSFLPGGNIYWCITGAHCELGIEGPDGEGIAIFDDGKLVQRPQVIHQPRRAWKEIVPGRMARMRDGLVDCERAIATGDRHAALVRLRDADDAIDDIVMSLPMSQPGAIDYEILRDDTRIALAHVETITAEDVATLRVALSKLRTRWKD